MVAGKRIRHSIPETRWPSAAEAARSLLFSPITLGARRARTGDPKGQGPSAAADDAVMLEQRTWVPAMVPWRASESGEVTPELLEWYGRFADGRPGAIVVEATGIRDVPSGPLLRIGDDRFVPGLRALVEQVRRRSQGHTRLLIQLIDFLAIKRRPAPEKYFTRFFLPAARHGERLAEVLGAPEWRTAPADAVRAALLRLEFADPPAVDRVLDARELEALRFGARERVTDVHRPHIRALPAVLPGLFAAAAHRSAIAGFDGVELHFAHAYTMASFLSRTNDRDDGYGGSVEGRLRAPLEVYRAARAALPPGVALGCRFLGDEVIAGGSGPEDAVQYALAFARAGMDYLSLSTGGKFDDARQPKVGHAAYPYTGPSGQECMPTVYSDARGPFGRNLHMARAVRQALRSAGLETPIVAAGGITTFAIAEGALERGDCDIIASARQSLADPDWFRKVRAGRGAEVRRCQLTNYCEGLDQQHKQVTCRLWDREDGDGEGSGLRSADGKRRLVAPPWVGSESAG